ncbi:hypothetical protein BpHYR1_046543 [Brachionus plicatilis]|uniref:Uncharacterized protein n=1 Tax=Brachionus plicatilis TaxID=10195 RepID=A0A3M7REP6_BRAPC|nr:hypothetical protein BpHYR1_046543 [Brachionus plicatilis]
MQYFNNQNINILDYFLSIPQHYLAFAGLPAFAFKATYCHYLNNWHSVITQLIFQQKFDKI